MNKYFNCHVSAQTICTYWICINFGCRWWYCPTSKGFKGPWTTFILIGNVKFLILIGSVFIILSIYEQTFIPIPKQMKNLTRRRYSKSPYFVYYLHPNIISRETTRDSTVLRDMGICASTAYCALCSKIKGLGFSPAVSMRFRTDSSELYPQRTDLNL